MNKRKLGSEYEEKARHYLERRGMEFLDRNIRGSFGEIDLIFREENTVIFVEVKFRKTKRYGYGAEAVDKTKARRLYLTAMEYIYRKKLHDMDVRFDLVAFDSGKLKWTRNIIWGDSFGF